MKNRHFNQCALGGLEKPSLGNFVLFGFQLRKCCSMDTITIQTTDTIKFFAAQIQILIEIFGDLDINGYFFVEIMMNRPPCSVYRLNKSLH